VLGERLEQFYGRRLPYGPFLAALRNRGADDLELGRTGGVPARACMKQAHGRQVRGLAGAWGGSMPDVTANGLRLFYQQSGSGPDVVLVHAVTSNQAVWVFTGLADAWRPTGSGSPPTTCAATGPATARRPGTPPPTMATDFRALHAALGLGPAVVVGHSFGGVVGLHTALLHPECVRGVILSDSYFPGLRHVEPNYGKPNVWVDLRETFRKVGIDLGETVDFARLFRTAAELNPEQLRTLDDIVGPVGRGWLRQLPRSWPRRLAATTCSPRPG
jgi:3-oxoadipate enol-lactonase